MNTFKLETVKINNLLSQESNFIDANTRKETETHLKYKRMDYFIS